MLKIVGWGGVGGPCDFSVSPRSKSFFFLFLGDFYSTWGCWDRGPDLDLDQGLTKVGLRLDTIPVTATYLTTCKHWMQDADWM